MSSSVRGKMAEVNKAANRAARNPTPVIKTEVKYEATPPVAKEPSVQPKPKEPAKRQAKKKTAFYKKI
tara:strand:+ start:2158 stop:2361 length:204 start_codon:yes stop_codon:yes gene_type:complete